MIRNLLILVLAVASSSLPTTLAATGPDVWMLTLLGSDDEDGNCAAQAATIGQQVQDAFHAAVPDIVPYDPEADTASGTARFLRSSSAAANLDDHRRRLAIKLCARSYCSKPRNWDACLWSGCQIRNGRRRELQQIDTISSSPSDILLVLKAKRDLDKWVTQQGVKLGCDLGLIMEKMRG